LSRVIDMDSASTIESIEHQIDLSEGEEVLFERDNVVLTNLRLMAEWSDGEAGAVVLVKEIDGVRNLNGGHDSKLGSGIKVLTVGAALMAFQLLVERFVITSSANSGLNIVNVVLFVIAAVGLGIGAHLIVTSLIRVKPHTSLFFIRFKNKDVRVSFPGRNNEDAELLRAAFNRQKRAISY
jgi:hypothetical protein